MAIYEYRCGKCGKVTAFFEKAQNKDSLFVRLKRRCKNCGSRELSRIFSNFTAIKQESSTDMLNEISRMGPVNFVPDYRPQGPPPGGCPYAQPENSSNSTT